MVSLKQMKSLIRDVCSKMGDKYASEDAINSSSCNGYSRKPL